MNGVHTVPAALELSNYRYAEFNHLGGARDYFAAQLAPAAEELTLDLCSGTGNFALALAKAGHSLVLGIDLVPGQVRRANEHSERLGLASRCFFSCGDLTALPPLNADLVTLFLGFCELLKCFEVNAVFDHLSRLLKPGGQIALIDEFVDDAGTEAQRLGFDVHHEIGYRYVKHTELMTQVAARSDLSVVSSKLKKTHRPKLNVAGCREYIRAECAFNLADGTEPKDPERVFQQFEGRLKRLGGMEVNGRLRMTTLRK
jgi:ubiquinone/menaquinone biosynthesis C-methylase UbiE